MKLGVLARVRVLGAEKRAQDAVHAAAHSDLMGQLCEAVEAAFLAGKSKELIIRESQLARATVYEMLAGVRRPPRKRKKGGSKNGARL